VSASGVAVETPPAGQLESPRCATCGEDAFEVLRPSRRAPGPIDLLTVFRSSGDEPLQDQLARCRSCGLVYVRPRLHQDLILQGYQGGTDEGFVSQAASRERTFRRCLDRVEAAICPPGRRVLDVGAAGGSFLAMARERGYEPSGCEPSGWMCGFARDHYSLALHAGTLFDMPLEDTSVHLLTLWDVLEHTPDPRAVLERSRALLVSGGVLALTYPDYGSYAARALGDKWPFLLTVHLYYFDRRTMADLLARTGFRPLRFRPHLQTLETGYVMRRATPYLGGLGRLAEGAARSLRLDRLPFHYWVGQTMVVAVKA
jgi:2-polyprenyl-3-methyl-5-hydroxy-6-metoxy-1,4-benzoquinol methylase